MKGSKIINIILEYKIQQHSLPILIKINSNRYKNFRPYLKAGISSSINIKVTNSTGL